MAGGIPNAAFCWKRFRCKWLWTASTEPGGDVVTLTHGPPRTIDNPIPGVEVLFPEARRRRRRRRWGWAAAAACTVLIIAVVVTVDGHTAGRNTPHRSPDVSRIVSAPAPDEIVGWTNSFHVEVISTTTGSVERILASDVALDVPGLPTLSVSSGGLVFFDSDPMEGISPPNAQGDQIYSVPISGGPVREVAPGFDPAVSPDGRTLAFVASNGVGEAPYQLANGGIELAQLSGSNITGLRILHPSNAMLGVGISNLSWSSDSQMLSFDQLNPSTDSTSSWLLAAPDQQSSLDSAVVIPLHPAGLTWGGFFAENAKGPPMGIGVLTTAENEPPLANPQKVVSIDPQSGEVVRTLFTLPEAICTSSSPSAPKDCDADFSDALDADSGSSNVLISGAIPLRYGQVSTSGLAYLLRWDPAFAKPVRVTSGVLVAAWGPPPVSSTPQPR
jgi:hypothetical protein